MKKIGKILPLKYAMYFLTRKIQTNLQLEASKFLAAPRLFYVFIPSSPPLIVIFAFIISKIF